MFHSALTLPPSTVASGGQQAALRFYINYNTLILKLYFKMFFLSFTALQY